MRVSGKRKGKEGIGKGKWRSLTGASFARGEGVSGRKAERHAEGKEERNKTTN